MLCKQPYFKGLLPLGCGQCRPCRINRRRMWAHRLMLERDSHQHAAFVTLTYRDEEIHDRSGTGWSAHRAVEGNLVPNDGRLWLKAIRKRVAPKRLRYYLVGEYGSETERPHYHLALFGFPSCVDGGTRYDRQGKAICCENCKSVEASWGKGRVHLGELNKDSCEYLAKYVVKKWTREDQWTKTKLKGRHPEFCRMSLKPGIGADAIKQLCFFGVHHRGAKKFILSTDAPAVLQRGSRTFPLGRYLKKVWRESLGRSGNTPDGVKQELQKRMQKLYRDDQERLRTEGFRGGFVCKEVAYARKNFQKIKSLEAREKIFSKAGSL